MPRVPLRFAARNAWVVLVPIALACAGTPPKTTGTSLAPCPDKPNCWSSLAPDAEHRTEPFLLAGERGWSALRDAVAAMPRTKIVEDRPGYLHAESRSRIFGFVDDLELLRGAGDRVDVRSASRVGYGDQGVNQARIAALRDALVARGVVSAH
jgi:uncharacterized protein (DUF1499 family)